MKFTNKRYRRGETCGARLMLGLSQQQLADALGVSRSSIAMLETGKRKLPKSVEVVYLELCRQAEKMNPNGIVIVKRGRKPKGIATGRVYVDVTKFTVTNSEASQPADGPGAGQQNVTALTIAETPKTKEEVRREQDIEQLKVKKTLLTYQFTGLEFKRRALEKSRQALNEALLAATTRRNYNEALAVMLPNAKLFKTFKALAKSYESKAYQLGRRLEKCGPVALLLTELQMGLMETGIGVLEQAIAKLEYETVKTVEAANVQLLPVFPVMEQRVCA